MFTRNPIFTAVMILVSLFLLAVVLLAAPQGPAALIVPGVFAALVLFGKRPFRRLILGIAGVVYTEPNNISDIVLSEENFDGSREEVTIASGEDLAIGTVLGKVTADGKCKILAPAAVDGTETAYGVLISPGGIDASLADVKGAAVVRLAILKDDKLVWPAGITAEQKAAALDNLAANHVRTRATA